MNQSAPTQKQCPYCGQIISPYYYTEHLVEVHGTWNEESARPDDGWGGC